ncbi:MAG: hypothetical protein HYZ27_02185 [Deltaproteobacteria bacterium]|nr:hypothetical protein [Deltaproteobacteria bacterium]
MPRGFCLVALAAACAPPDDLGPQVVTVFARDADGDYVLTDRLLATLESARHIRGGATRLRGGGSLVLEQAVFSDDVNARTEEELAEVDLIRDDARVEADYVREGDVLVPLDWETLLMFSFYHHMERGQTFLRALGVADSALPSLRAYFHVRFTSLLLWGLPLVTDNAGYTSIADAFLIFPQAVHGNGVPLATNEGVVVHELWHATKHHLVHGNRLLPRYLSEEWPNAAANSYRADDEGLADFLAAAYTGDPDFITVSVSEVSLDRDLRETRNFTPAMHAALTESITTYNPYPLGSALAAWLWAVGGGDQAAREAVAGAAVQAMVEVAPVYDSNYAVTVLIDAIVQRLEVTLAARACALLDARLTGAFRDVPACGISP